MLKLIDTERPVQQPLDRTASSILTDRSLPFERASWQQCSCCDEWIEDQNIEYTFECVLGVSPSGTPTVNFELKTRYPAYACKQCTDASPRPGRHACAQKQDPQEAAGEAEQLCPLHVQAVYMVQGSAKNNIGAITKGFIVHCPDCGRMSNLLQTPYQVKSHIWQHFNDSSSCQQSFEALAADLYESSAAFGGYEYEEPVAPEKVVKELMGRLIVMTACHIVYNTRPPPTPINQLTGVARVAAAASAELRSSNANGTSSDGQQLLPYRAWAVDALSLDSELLTEANWVRPSLAGLALEHKPSLLDLVLAPPYIAVAEHDAGMTVDKLAVLLLREQQRQQYGALAGLAAAAAAGERLPAAVAATETALAQVLAHDSVLQHVPEAKRVQQFLDMASIPTIGDVVYALAQPHVHGRTSRNLNVCAVCGMTPGALKRAKRSYALHRCKYCIVSTCQSCRHEQQAQQPVPATLTEAAAAEQLCLWCQGHPDTLGGEVLFSNKGRGRRSKRLTAAAEFSGDAAPAAAWGAEKDSDISWGYGAASAAGGGTSTRKAQQQYRDYDQDVYSEDDADGLHRSSQQYDLAIELAATAAAAEHLGQGSCRQTRSTAAGAAPHSPLRQGDGRSWQPEAKSDFHRELELLQQLQLELEQLLGAPGLQPAEGQQQQGHQQAQPTKRRVSSDTAAAVDAAYKRQRTQQQQTTSHSYSHSTPLAAARGDQAAPAQQHQGSHYKASPGSKATAAAAGGSGGDRLAKRRPPRVPRCGRCNPCKNIHLKKGCVVNRRRLQEGKPFIAGLDAAAAAADMLEVDTTARYDHYSEPDMSDLEPPSPGTAQAADILAGLLSAGVFELPADTESADAAAGSEAGTPAADSSHTLAASALQLQEHDAAYALEQQQQPADARVSVTAGLAPGKCLQQEASTPAAAVGADPDAVLERHLDRGIALLHKDIGSYCAVIGTDSDKANATVQDIQGLEKKLVEAYKQTGEQLFKTGLQILLEIVDTFNSLVLPASKVALACNLQLKVPAAYGPQSEPCTIFDVLVCSWYKELRDTELTPEQAKATAATRGSEATIAGLSQEALSMLARLSYIHMLHHGAQQAVGSTDRDAGVAAIQQAAVLLASALGLLLLHWPEQRDELARNAITRQWRGCAQKWEVAVDYQNVVGAAREMQQAFNVLRTHMAINPCT